MKCRAFKLLLFLLALCVAGAIINVAVCFGIIVLEKAMFSPAGTFAMARGANDTCININRHDSSLTTLLFIGRTGGRAGNQSVAESFNREVGDPLTVTPSWFDIQSLTPEFAEAVERHGNEQVSEHQTIVGIGWPARSFSSLALHEVRFGVKGILFHQKQSSASFPGMTTIMMSNRGLPDRLIWSGFVVNTLVFAAVLWLLFVVNPILRRRQRIKRGLCESCGYSLRGRGRESVSDKCPECGATTM